MKKPVILIVDDIGDVRKTLREYLEMRFEGEFNEAADGDEAAEFIKSYPCDLVLLDIKMPKKSGIIVIKEAKEYNPKIDILIVSAYLSDDVVKQAFEYGATDYCVKPVNLMALESKIVKILEKRGQHINKT